LREYTLHWSEDGRWCAKGFPSVTAALRFVHERGLARRCARIEDIDERVIVSEAHMLAAREEYGNVLGIVPGIPIHKRSGVARGKTPNIPKYHDGVV